MDIELAITVSLDRAVEVLDHDEAGLMMVFGTCQSEYKLEYLQNPIPYAVIVGFSKGLEFLKPEYVVFVVQKHDDQFYLWAGDREGRTKTMKVPFKLVDGDVVVDGPTGIGTLDCLPIELFWGDGQ